MAWFGKKKKQENEKTALKKQEEINNQQNSQIINQQNDIFSVDPGFFESDKVKVNEFLTDDKEYNTKKLIADCPNGDYRNLNINENYLELQARMAKDEAAFHEIHETFRINENTAMNEFEIAKNKAIQTLSTESPYIVSSTNYSDKQIKNFGKGINNQIEHISEKTAKFLKDQHTKILNLNEINETIVSSHSYTDQGGTQTTKPYNSVNGGVNKYKTLMKVHNISQDVNAENQLDAASFEDLNTIKVTQRLSPEEREQLPTKPLTKKLTVNYVNQTPTKQALLQSNERLETIPEQIVAPRTPTRIMPYDHQEPRTVNLNSSSSYNNSYNQTANLFGNRTSSLSVSSTRTVSQPIEVTHLDDLIVKDIQNKTNAYMSTRSVLTESEATHGTSLLTRTANLDSTYRTTSSLSGQQSINYGRLIPYNEVKMDHRVRKSQRREYKFFNGGSF